MNRLWPLCSPAAVTTTASGRVTRVMPSMRVGSSAATFSRAATSASRSESYNAVSVSSSRPREA